jgi:hypothetical protein
LATKEGDSDILVRMAACKYLRYLANYLLFDDGKIFANVA